MFSYDPEKLELLGKDYVRFRIGDVDKTATTKLEDEEINGIIAVESSFPEAVAKCCEALAARLFKSATSKSLASVKVQYQDTVDRLLSLADSIRKGTDAIAATDLVITGTSKADLATSAADTDLVQPAFTRGQFDNPGATVEAEA